MLKKELRKIIVKKRTLKPIKNISNIWKQKLFYSEKTEDDFESGGEFSIKYTLDTENNVCFRDHKVDGKHCFPTDAYLEFIYILCQMYFEFDAITMDNIIISTPIVAQVGESLDVKLCFTQFNEGLKFKLVSDDNNPQITSKIFIRGEIANHSVNPKLKTIFPLVDSSFIKKIDVNAFYKKDGVIFLGELYHALQSIDYFEDYAIGSLLTHHDNNQFSLNPPILNAALGCAISFVTNRLSEQFSIGTDYFLPYKINGLTLFKPLSEPRYGCLVSMNQQDKHGAECRLQLFNDKGEVCFEIDKLRLQRIANHTVFEKQKETNTQPESIPFLKDNENEHASLDDVAIIGVSCKFPKSKNIDDFWDVLNHAQDCIEEVPTNRWTEFKQWYNPDPAHKGTSNSKWGGFIEDYDCFDPLFFNISPAEAELMDPQQRIFLEEAWKAIENAGYAADALTNTTCGVYVGCTSTDYSHVLAKTGNEKDAQVFTGTSSAILAARISYFLNLKGPSLAIDTACSSSLTAIHLASESIRHGENELAIAGGVNIFSTPLAQVLTFQTGMQSPDGRCHTFDEGANGTVFSEGCGVILLKSLQAAIRDGDTIWGIIRGSGINQDGKTNGITAPSARSQEKLLAQIYHKYRINPEKINYIEAHGTGTPLGDPIEIQGLVGAFRQFTKAKGFCAIGSVKSNIGHASYAAGVAGLIKLLLCIKHKQLVASLHYNTPNKHIHFSESPFFVNNENRPWEPLAGEKRIAAVSSFGFNGSNAHIVIEEYCPLVKKLDIENELYMVPLSAKSYSSLKKIALNLRYFLSKSSSALQDITMRRIAYTLQVGRNSMPVRMVFLVANTLDFIQKLDLMLNQEIEIGIKHGIFHNGNNLDKKYEPVAEVPEDSIKQWFLNGKFSKIAEYWVSGRSIDWNTLYGDAKLSRVTLPTYPFERERYWPKMQEPSLKIKEIQQEHSIGKEPIPQTHKDKTTNHQDIEYTIKTLIHQTLKIPLLKLDINANFSDFGFDSINLVKFASLITDAYGFTITPAKLFANSTISRLVHYLQYEHAQEMQAFDEKPSLLVDKVDFNLSTALNDDPIAIIGMSGKFPQSEDLDTYWYNLQQGRDCIAEIPLDRWNWQDYYRLSPTDLNKTDIIWGGFMDGIRQFDPQFFGFSEEETALMDPQHRLLMTYTYKVIEDAGYDPKSLSKLHVGVFIAIGNDGYDGIIEKSGKSLDINFTTGTLPSLGPNRISYFFDFKGPSESIEVACASSLVAIHRAIHEINNGACDIAIVGSVNCVLTPYGHLAFDKAGLLSKNGHCKPFSSEADGFVRSEGIGILLLKRLSLAKKDNDNIHAIVKGIGVNHNGRANFLTAPNPNAQSDLLESVYNKAGIDINTITYIETHGTGTPLGDAVEIEGLKCAYKNLLQSQNHIVNNGLNPHRCALGSVKGNIGHTELSSGMASIIKVLYQMKHKTLVKSIHCDSSNPHLQLENCPFYIVRENQAWHCVTDKTGEELPRRAGVSAFGLGGVNAHIVLEEYVNKFPVLKKTRQAQLFVLSAKNQDQLRLMAKKMHQFLAKQEDMNLFDLAYTLQIGREPMNIRFAMVVDDMDDLLNGLKNYEKVIQPTTLLQESGDGYSLKELLEKNDLERLRQFWVNGGEINWDLLHRGQTVTRVSLPGHQFCEQNYWVTKTINSCESEAPEDKTKSIDGIKIKNNPLFLKWYGQPC
ncbi:MAG: polyketide synthase dehydratase domain-containing protein [Legionella sp.]|nr:polyketide synthase dehydratase domain-containing protein [Legionella sp.]